MPLHVRCVTDTQQGRFQWRALRRQMRERVEAHSKMNAVVDLAQPRALLAHGRWVPLGSPHET